MQLVFHKEKCHHFLKAGVQAIWNSITGSEMVGSQSARKNFTLQASLLPFQSKLMLLCNPVK